MDILRYINTTLALYDSAETQRNYKRNLRRFAEWYDKESDGSISHAAVIDFLDWLRESNEDEPKSPQYYTQHIAAVKQLVSVLSHNGKVELHTAMAIRGIKTPKIKTIASGNLISNNDMAAMLDACQSGGDIGARDAAILSMLHSTGARRSEVALLHTSNVNGDIITIRETKTDEDRKAHLNKGAYEHFEKWMSIRGGDFGNVFLKFKTRKGKAEMTNQGIHPQTIYSILHNRMSQAGIESRYTPHDFRKTFISTLLDEKIDPITIAHLSGHKSTDTIKLYDLSVRERAKEAAQKIKTPGVRVTP